MEFKLFAVGDVVADGGLAYLKANLPALKREHGIDFCVVNEIGRASCRERV